jgi:hypothetical protein
MELNTARVITYAVRNRIYTPADNRAISAIITAVCSENYLERIFRFSSLRPTNHRPAKGSFWKLSNDFRRDSTIITKSVAALVGSMNHAASVVERTSVHQPTICGRLISQYLEHIMTYPHDGSVGARVPYKGDSNSTVAIYLSAHSNGFEARETLPTGRAIRLLKDTHSINTVKATY